MVEPGAERWLDPAPGFEALLDRLREDTRVVGVVLSGSRARAGTATARSDFDVVVVVADDAEAGLRGEARRGLGLDVTVVPLTAFGRRGLPGDAFAWDRYSFVG